MKDIKPKENNKPERAKTMKTKAATKSKKPQVKVQDMKPKKDVKGSGKSGGRTWQPLFDAPSS